MTVARVSQVAVEVLRTNTAPIVRVSQVAVEVLRTNTAPIVRVSQVAVEVLRINTGTRIRVSHVAVEVLRPNVPVVIGDTFQSVFKLNAYSVSGGFDDAASVLKFTSYVIAETEVVTVFKLQSYSITSPFAADAISVPKIQSYTVSNPFSQTEESISKFAAYTVTYPQSQPVVTKLTSLSVIGAPNDAVSIQKVCGYVVKRPAPVPDPVVATYPESLPNPRVADVTATERRRLPQTSTTFEATARSRDRISKQNLTWTLSADQAQIFDEWWETDLEFGGKWFEANWPNPRGFITIHRKFIDVPRWTHLGNSAFEISVTCEIRDIKVH